MFYLLYLANRIAKNVILWLGLVEYPPHSFKSFHETEYMKSF